jgi:curli biogenesis system outer membrane secretion channel CsgG
MRRVLAQVFLLAGLGGALAAQEPPAKRRIAVLDFDYATVHAWVVDAFGSDQDIGKGIADMLVTNLVRNGTYSVIERKQLDRILQEQNFQQSGRADPASAVKLARLLGVDAIIIGSITQFGRDDKKLGVGAAGGGVRVGGIGLGGLGRKTAKAVVQIDARLVSTTTAEILGVATGHGESKRSGMTLVGGAEVGGVGGVGAFDMSSSNFGNTILGEATRSAVDSLTGQIVAVAPQIAETKVEIHALVADVSGNDLIINVGTGAGVRVGAEYAVVRPGREIKDPATGRVLRRITTTVGKLKVTSADESSAQGTLTGGPAKVGDCVGACPSNTPAGGGGGPDPSSQPASSASAAVPGPRAALPALYTAPITGAFTWGMYAFKGTEHFRYDVSQTERGETKTGYYVFDATPAAGGGGRYRLTVDGRLGGDAYGSSVMIAPNEGIPMMQLASLGPAVIALFNPAWGFLFMGHQWEVGSYWTTTRNGKTSAFKVESTCQQAGVSGLRGVWRENDKVIIDMCVSPNVGLPLAVTMNEEDGSNSTTMRLVEFKP